MLAYINNIVSIFNDAKVFCEVKIANSMNMNVTIRDAEFFNANVMCLFFSGVNHNFNDNNKNEQ